MVVITVEDYQNGRVHTITVKNKGFFWVKMKDVQDRLGIMNITDLLRKEICGRFGTKDLAKKQKMKYIRFEYQITKNFKDSNLYKYAKNKLMEKIIKNCSGVKKCNDGVNRLDKEDQRRDFRILLGFKENEIYERKEHSIVKRIKKIFKKQTIIEEYRVEKYFIDLFFPVHKLGIEIDENGHLDTSEIKEPKREQAIKKVGINIIRINPDKENFDTDGEIGEIKDFIYASGKKLAEESTTKPLIEDSEKMKNCLNSCVFKI